MEILGERPAWSMNDGEKLSQLDATVAELARHETYYLHLIADLDASGYAKDIGAGDTARFLSTLYRIDPTKARRDLRVAKALAKYDAVAAALPDPSTPFAGEPDPSDPTGTDRPADWERPDGTDQSDEGDQSEAGSRPVNPGRIVTEGARSGANRHGLMGWAFAGHREVVMHEWLLSAEERGNPATDIDDDGSWIEGNLVRPLVHGATYFRQLYDELRVLRPGDRVYFTDWRGDPDEALVADGPSVGTVLCELARAGVEVRALLWRSHSDHVSFSSQENQHFGTELNEAGGEVLLDQRVRRLASHHQKVFVIRHRDHPEADVAFVGGIDLCHGRRDDARHLGDPQPAPMDPRYGDRAPWHDVMLEVRGPAVGDLLRCFVERWDDPHPLDRRTPYRMLIQRLARMPRHPSDLPEAFPDPPVAGPHTVQVLRTYAHKHPGFPFAPRGEHSVARAYLKAFARARSLIYVEDQYLWSSAVTSGVREALERSPELRVIAVVPRYPDQDGRISGPPARWAQLEALRLLESDRVAVYNLENENGVPIYVHAKVCIVDDEWLTCGSDNFNRRSWTNDSELTCAVDSPELARSLRLELWSEHLGTDDPELDPIAGFNQWQQQAAVLDNWHATGCPGPRPPGRIRPHRPEPVTRLQSRWAAPLARHLYDPDGRPRAMRRRNAF